MLNSASREDLEFVRLLGLRVGIGTYGITEQLRQGLPGRALSSIFRIHFINEDLTEDFFLLREHRARFVRATKKWTRRGWVVRVRRADRPRRGGVLRVRARRARLRARRQHPHRATASVATRAATRSRSCARSSTSTSSTRSSGLRRAPGITLRYDDKSVAKDRTAQAAVVARRSPPRSRSTTSSCSSRPTAAIARRYLAARGVRRRRGAAVPARMVTRRLGPAERAPAAEEVRARRHRRRRARVREQGEQAAGPVPRLACMFPIYDSGATPSASVGARSATSGPKYKNSPETPIYQKSRLLYGLNWAKGEIVARGEVVICEGYTDVMAFALAGAPNAVATCGTALADDHFQILKNLARKVVLAYDADAAGQGAAEKWYGWEQRYEIQLEVADLPAGRDPADVWHDDPQALLAARRTRHAVPRSSGSTAARGRRPRVARGPAHGPARSRGGDRRRAPERPRARPVRDEARRRPRHRRRPHARNREQGRGSSTRAGAATTCAVERTPVHG